MSKTEKSSALVPAEGGSNMGLYIGLGVFALVAAGGAGYYFYAQGKKKEEAAAKKAAADVAAASEADKVPLIKDGKPVAGKDGKPVLVDPSAVQAGKPIFDDKGKPITGKDGQPITPSAADVKALTAAATSGGADATTGGAKSNAYVRGSTIDKRNANTDSKPYTQNSPDQQAFLDAISDTLNLAPAHKKLKARQKRENERAAAALKDAELYVRGFMKGMNLAPSAGNVGLYRQAIIDYMNSPAKLKESGIDKVGYILTTKDGQLDS